MPAVKLIRAALVVAVLIALPALAGATEATPATGASAKPRPNVIVILTDDQTLESMWAMPRVNRLLAREGATFDNFFVSFSLCCPSRAVLLTGQYNHNNGVLGNTYATGMSRLDASRTLPVWMKHAGYRTAFVGKYLNGYGKFAKRVIPPGWDDWYAGTSLGYFGHSMNRNGKLVRYRNSYQTDVYTNTALSVIKRDAKARQPFFLWLSYFAPHHGDPKDPDDLPGVVSPSPAPRHRNAFAGAALPRPPSFNEEDIADKPSAVRVKSPLTPELIAAETEAYQQRLEAMLAVDEGVARIVQALKAAGELDNTVIMYTSDNGYMQGEHRIVEGKEVGYEPSIRVPLIVRGPGVAKDVHIAQEAINVDLAPTVAQFAQATATRDYDGRSLVPVLRDPGIRWARDLLIQRGPGVSVDGPRLFTGIRAGHWKYLEHWTGEKELYDLSLDPDEVSNLAGKEPTVAIQAELAARLAALRNCAGLTCRELPPLALKLNRTDGCIEGARITGVAEPEVRSVTYEAGGRAMATVGAAPFNHPLSSSEIGPGLVRIRALITLADGREQTIDKLVRACSS